MLRPVAAIVVAGLLSCSCVVTTYQPLSALQSPVGVDLARKNLAGTAVALTCTTLQPPERRDDTRLCDLLARLFEVQGAKVAFSDEGEDVTPAQAAGKEAPMLSVEVTSETVSEKGSFLASVFYVASFTLFPLEESRLFRLRQTVRDADGFVLHEAVQVSRVTEVVGVGYYAANWLMNSLVRDDHEELSTDVSKQRLSTDYYGQLVQAVVNANARRLAVVDTRGATKGAPSP